MMIRESRRQKLPKLSKNLERQFKEKKCRKCSVIVTRMDFAKILGKFTKVKIQYESASPSGKRVSIPSAKAREALKSPNTIARLKSNENGMVLLPRTAYNEHPAKDLKSNRTRTLSPKNSNVLKENNRLKKTPLKQKLTSSSGRKVVSSNLKEYKIVFKDPKARKKDTKSKTTLSELVSSINVTILPTEEWCIDYFPRNEVKDEKVYDRIAAELEDLMSNDKPKEDGKEANLERNDDFPSIMDILNDNTGEQTLSNSDEIKSTLESSDVEAMLLGKVTESPTKPMEVDKKPIDEVSKQTNQEGTQIETSEKNTSGDLPDLDNPGSPSILNEKDEPKTEGELKPQSKIENSPQKTEVKTNSETPKISFDNNNSIISDPDSVTFVVFKKTLNGKCCKSVTCTKSLNYTIELEGKTVEFLGAPKYVSSLEDLKVLLQIVNESELQSLYVLQ